MTMTYDTTYDTQGKPLLTASQYADAVGASERTVKRWLAADEIPGAQRDPSGRWLIPADAERVPTPAGVVQMLRDTNSAVDVRQLPTPAEIVEQLPALVPVGEDLARLLGIPETAIRRNHDDYFQLKPFGPHGSLVMPRHRIKEIFG